MTAAQTLLGPTATLAQLTTETGNTLVAQNIFFAIIAVIMVFSAFRVVTTKNVVHAALHLVLVLGGVAAIYVLLTAEFVAVVQVLVYIGAIVVLLLFGIMLTEARLGKDQNLNNDYRVPAVITAVALLAVMSYALWDQFDDQKLPEPRFSGTDDPALVDFALDEYPELFDELTPSDESYDAQVTEIIQEREAFFNGVQDTEEVSDSIFSTYIIPFEAISVLLLAALIGAIVLARKE